MITEVPVPATPSWLLEPLWDQFAALLPNRPVYDPFHPLGCHRPRTGDRIIFEKLAQFLRFGCSYEPIAGVGIAGSASRSRQRGLQSSLANTMPRWLVICTAGSVPGVRSHVRAAAVRAAAGSFPRISAPSAAYSITASRSDQSGIERGNSRSIVAASWSGRSSSTGPGAMGRVPARVRAEAAGDVFTH